MDMKQKYKHYSFSDIMYRWYGGCKHTSSSSNQIDVNSKPIPAEHANIKGCVLL